MDIGFDWDEEKYLEVNGKHNILFYELVSAFDDKHGFYSPDPQGNEYRTMFVGSTFSGRIVSIIYSDVEDAPLIRIITAFEAKGEILNEYYKGIRI